MRYCSSVNKGSLFQLQLPYRLSEQLLKPTARNDEADYSGLYSGKVLVADDTELIQMVIRTILESYGAEVTIAENGLRAVELSRSQPFDLIFMDMQMPVMDGIEATTTIRADQNAVPIVALTANVMEKHREQFFSAGCDAFLEKPINRDELKRELGQFLKKDSRKPIATAEEDKPRKPDQPHNGASKKAVVDVSEDMQQIFLRKVLTRNRKSLIDALNRDDTEEVFRVAHTLKGSGSTFGFPSVSRLAAMVCDVIENHNGEQTTRYVSELTDEIDHIQGSSKNVGLLVR